MTEFRDDGFLGGRLRIRQPAKGYRAGADAVMLAAACPAMAGQAVLELGCGAGTASLCLGWRVPGLALSGIEMQEDYAELARMNAAGNRIALDVVTGDIARMPQALRAVSFDHVIANPPYFLGGSAAPDPGRAGARQEATALAVWIDAALRRLRPKGQLTLIQRADRLADVLACLGARVGDIAVLPVSARRGHQAGRVIIVSRKGARAPMRLLAPFIMHADDRHLTDREDLTPAASAVLREGAAITGLFVKAW